MNHKKISVVLLLVVFLSFSLSGCWQAVPEAPKPKQIIEIRTQSIHNADNTGYISKSAKVQWSSEITITSQVAGRVQSLPRRIGDRVSQGTLVTQLQDINNTSNSLANAKIALERARLAEQTTRADITKQQQKIDYDLNNSNALLTGSSTQIQLAKLQKDLEKAEFDYQSKIKADNQTNENLITTARNIQSDLQIILTDTVTETDKLLGITDLYINDTNYKDMRIYIAAKNITIKESATTNFWTIKALEQTLQWLKSKDITADNVNDYLKNYQSIVVSLSDHFVIMKQVFVDSIEDSRYKTQMTASQTLFSTLQSKASALNASITSQLNSIRSYFASYQDNQESLARQIESLRAQIELTKKSLDDATFNTTLWAERNEIGFDSQIKNTQFSTQSAELWLQQAQFALSKFSIVTPIDGSVADVLVDVGQEVAPGTPLLKIISPQQQIETTLTIEEVKNISLWQSVVIESDIGSAAGTIVSLATTADKSWSFKVIISLKDSTLPTGIFVQIKIPIQQGTVVLPINALTIVDTNSAMANFRDTKNKTIVSKKVTIHAIFGDQVEITDNLPMNYELIITDLSNYDERIMEIQTLSE